MQIFIFNIYKFAIFWYNIIIKNMDYVKLEKLVNKVKRISGADNKRKALNLLFDEYYKAGDAQMICELGLNFLKIADLDICDKYVFALKNGHASYRFCRFVKTPNFKEHEKIVLEQDNPSLSNSFSNIKGADLKAHSQIILNHNTAFYSCQFAGKHSNIHLKEHMQVILNSKNPYYCYELAKNLQGKNCDKLEKCILEINNDIFCYFYAKDVPNANIKAHETCVLSYGEPEQCYLFAKDVKGANLAKHIMLIKHSDDSKKDEYLAELIELKKKTELEELNQMI